MNCKDTRQERFAAQSPLQRPLHPNKQAALYGEYCNVAGMSRDTREAAAQRLCMQQMSMQSGDRGERGGKGGALLPCSRWKGTNDLPGPCRC